MTHKGPLGLPSTFRHMWAAKALFALLLVAPAGFSLAGEASSVERLVPDTMEARVAACVQCHGSHGRAGPDGFYPRIAGKPKGYLLAQLLNFRDGRRNYEPMRHLLHGLPEDYLSEIAEYFADMRLPYDAPVQARASAALLERGRTLAELGDPSRELPACAACHGASFSGMEPSIPGLLGLPRDYCHRSPNNPHLGSLKIPHLLFGAKADGYSDESEPAHHGSSCQACGGRDAEQRTLGGSAADGRSRSLEFADRQATGD